MKLESNIVFYILLSYCIVACSSQQQIVPKPQVITTAFTKKQELTEKEKQHWHFKDMYTDSIPGISLNKAYQFLKNRKAVRIIVAVIDSDVDINHKGLKYFLWKNKKEIAGNNIDDDNNGYIDDIYGWNFTGKKNSNESLPYTRMEETRILSKYTKKQLDLLYSKKKLSYNYAMVKSSYDAILKRLNENLKLYKDIEAGYSTVVDTLKSFSKFEYITLNNIDNIKSEDTYIKQCIAYAKDLLNQGYTYELIKSTLDYKINCIKICMNLEYDNRVLVGDKSYDFFDTNYGNPLNGKMASKIDHGTKVSGVIVNFLNALTYKGNIKIMPLCITGIGDFLDKDLALSIRYAVDNGAKVINLSQTKTFSLDDKKVKKAIRYAQNHDVLIVKSAGNENINLDDIIRFPNDHNKKGKEILENLLMVGASGNTITTLKDEDSNYGKNQVDVFAPGIDISTLKPNNQNTLGSGSSYSAPIVSGVAALIRSYYPNLTAAEVKQIIMESGVSYDIMVNKPSTNDKKELVPFSSLSKSGKIVNAYNALLMAEKVSKKKKKQQ